MTLRRSSLALLTAVLLMVPISAQNSPRLPPDSPVPPQQAPAQQTPAQQAPTPPKPAEDLPDSPGAAEGLVVPPAPDGPFVVFDTSMGRMTCQFFEKESPVTVANFVGLATGTKAFTDPITGAQMKGVRFYDGTTFHRVIANFMIQGGDRAGNGTGDGGFYIKDEFAPGLRFDREGRLAMANAGPGTGGTQFFITEAPQPELNGKHTIFGQCDPHAVTIVQAIARVEKDSQDKPTTPVLINKVTIVPEGQPLPPESPAPPAAIVPPATQ